MYVRKTYIAEDGKEFKYEGECRAYEAMLFDNQYASKLTPFVALFDKGGKPISFNRMGDTWFVYVKQVPDWENEKLMDIWDRAIPGQLSTIIGDYGEGWYFQGDYNEWYSWTKKEKAHEQMRRAFTQMFEQVMK